jgi:hypothetical protein
VTKLRMGVVNARIEDEDDDENEDDNESVVKRERDGARPGKTSKMARRISILYDIYCMML